MLDHRRGEQKLLSRIGPTLAQETPAPSGMRLGMHGSMVIAASVWGQSLAANGAEREPKRNLSSPGGKRPSVRRSWAFHGRPPLRTASILQIIRRQIDLLGLLPETDQIFFVR
jgi:hypothetical protein